MTAQHYALRMLYGNNTISEIDNFALSFSRTECQNRRGPQEECDICDLSLRKKTLEAVCVCECCHSWICPLCYMQDHHLKCVFCGYSCARNRILFNVQSLAFQNFLSLDSFAEDYEPTLELVDPYSHLFVKPIKVGVNVSESGYDLF